jgi:hypothetical protein
VHFVIVSHLIIVRQSNPITGQDRPLELQEFEAPRFLDNRHMKIVRLSGLRTGRLYPQEIPVVFISVRGSVDPRVMQGRRKRVWAPVEKKYFLTSPPARADRLKIFTLNQKLTLNCRVTWAYSERVNLYSGQIMILPRQTNTYAIQSGPGPPSGPPGSGNFYWLL